MVILYPVLALTCPIKSRSESAFGAWSVACGKAKPLTAGDCCGVGPVMVIGALLWLPTRYAGRTGTVLHMPGDIMRSKRG